MSLVKPFPWALYSKKLAQKIVSPRNGGSFEEQRNLRLAVGEAGDVDEGNLIRFYWLVDKEDGVIVDAKFLAYGQTALIGAADAACDLLPGKNYDQAKRIGADLLDKQLCDRSDTAAFPKETYPHLNMVLMAMEEAAEACSDLPLPSSYLAPPAPTDIGEVLEGGYPGFAEFSQKEKLALIEQVIEQEIRPYIALDGGGVEVLDLLHGRELVIGYQGNCTSCFSAVGATLSYIQQVIQAKVHPDITVIPNM